MVVNGAVTDGVAAMAAAVGTDAMVRTFEVKRKSAVIAIFEVRELHLAKRSSVLRTRIIILE
jgi:hypothetical protein